MCAHLCFLAIYLIKKSLHGIGGVHSVHSLQFENERLLLDVIIYIVIYIIKLIFLIKRSVNNELWTVDTVDSVVPFVLFKMLELSIIHCPVLSLPSAHIPPIHTERVDFLPMFR